LLKQCRIVLGVSKHQGNQPLSMRTWCPRRRRGLPESSAVSSSGCLKTPRRSVFLGPTPEERHAESSVVSSPVCLNAKMTGDFGDYAQGEGFPKDGASPTWRVSAPSHLALHCSKFPHCLMPTLEGNAPRHFLARCLGIKHRG